MGDFSLFDLQDTRLDEEWIRQVKLYHDHAFKLAEAREEWERAKANRDVVGAELDREIRRDPSKFGLEKITENVIEKTTLLQDSYHKAAEKVLTTKHTMDVAQVYVDTLDQRKKALECRTQLFIAGYYAEPKTPKVNDFIRESKADKAFGKKRPHNYKCPE